MAAQLGKSQSQVEKILSMPLIEVKGLKTHFFTDAGVAKAVDGVDFTIEPKETLALVGESGCGKTVTGRSIMGLVRNPPGRIVEGEILFHRPEGTVDLAKLDPQGREMRKIRGGQISMIFQEPMTSLNPVFTIGNQITETIILHQKLSQAEARKCALDALIAVKMPAPEQRLNEYPHQLSGGMRQRVMIAMAISCNPLLLIADEPTTALDVTVQAQVLNVMNELRSTINTSILFVTHDLGVVAQMADKVAVMYLGRIVEFASVKELFRNPSHPYTRGLMKSIPSLIDTGHTRLQPIEGTVPDLLEVPAGCGFASRCPHATDYCRREKPNLKDVGSNHTAACWLNDEIMAV
jgi:oligopeptide/dipeptide ABC transporter ATP-binding protein